MPPMTTITFPIWWLPPFLWMVILTWVFRVTGLDEDEIGMALFTIAVPVLFMLATRFLP